MLLSLQLHANTTLLVLVFLGFLLVSAFELCNLAKALSHLTLGPHVVHFASMVHLGHHDIDQPTTLCHIRNPLHLRMQSLPHPCDLIRRYQVSMVISQKIKYNILFMDNNFYHLKPLITPDKEDVISKCLPSWSGSRMGVQERERRLGRAWQQGDLRQEPVRVITNQQSPSLLRNR